VVESIGLEKGENGFESVRKLHYETSVRIPAGLKNLEDKEIRHKGVINVPDMPEAVYESLK
jgi:threonine synthase